ncbi:protein HGH1 homolog [Chelonus insularis]|uniref:protein HGH1 homolog n=1 Tax=Chelonus insularis TaxID=460826 RepID=UPI001589D87F|nr:protein HGH1 homolog [Chelonus insularis]
MESLEEINKYLNFDSRLDLQSIAVQSILGLTDDEKSRELLLSCPEILKQLILLCQVDSKRLAVAKDAVLALINISSDEAGANALLLISETSKVVGTDQPTDNLIYVCFRFILDKDCSLADPCCMVLSNMTRPSILVDRIVALTEKVNCKWDQIVYAFAYADKYNTKGAKLDYLGPVLSNLSQSAIVRKRLTDRNQPIIHKLLPFVEYKESLVRRGGVIGTLKNCCFDIDNHNWLLSSEVDILPYLLLPLAGPEEFDDEDNEKLPLDLQYLPETKQREPDPDIRIMLLEALCQLCATKEARNILRNKNAYVILREYHKREEDKAALLALENVINILIRTEEEIGVDNLKLLEVPTDYSEKFNEIDEEYFKS